MQRDVQRPAGSTGRPNSEIEEEARLDSGCMAEKIGLDRSFIADVERGKRNISILNLDIIAKGFKLSLARLVSKL
jgi:hypothetical protein